MKPCKSTPTPRVQRAPAIALAVLLAAGAAPGHADERAELEQVRATTMSLIEALVESGVLSREKADKLVQDAAVRARQKLAEAAPPPVATTSAAAPEIGRDGKRIVRVPYVSESTRREIREQLKGEVLAQAREERWANPGALPEWLQRFQFDGDLRLRADMFTLDRGNTAAGIANATNNNLTRGADLAGSNAAVVPNINTGEDFTRARLRARLGATVTLSERVAAGVRIATGNTTGPTSTNQTLGQGFNRYTLVLDRGYITVNPFAGLSLTGGRIANPFVSTDLVWADDLGFEGVAATYARDFSPAVAGFVTAGWFPLRTDNPLSTTPRNLSALQAGVNWKLARGSAFRLAAALYQYHGISGRQEDNARSPAGVLAGDYGTRDEYPAGLRQRGNTLFAINAPLDATQPTFWGLAAEFRSINLTGSLDIGAFDPVRVVLTGDYVKNLAFSRNSIFQRTGQQLSDGRDSGYLGRILVGQPNIRQKNDWNVSLTYRWLGSDAVLDAFTNSDFGLGGSNNKGFVVGGSLGIDKNTWVSLRWMASSLIDSMAPRLAGSSTAPTKLGVDLFQVDLNARF